MYDPFVLIQRLPLGQISVVPASKHSSISVDYGMSDAEVIIEYHYIYNIGRHDQMSVHKLMSST